MGAGPRLQENNSTKVLINKVVSEWILNIRLANPEVDGCPYPATGTLNTNIRTFFAALKNVYQWTFKKEDFKGFPGCFDGNIKEEYRQRMQKWVSQITLRTSCNTNKKYDNSPIPSSLRMPKRGRTKSHPRILAKSI
jgi:hypothetical protein